MGSGKGNPNTNPGDTSNTSGTSGATGTSGAAGNGGNAGPAGRPFTPERLVVRVPAGAPSGFSAGEQKVDDLFRQVFRGKIPEKPVDVFEKLGQVVQARKVEGRAVPTFEFTPRPLSGSSGPISGQSVAQTSLSERALAALADAEKRLAALRPMKTPSDPENLDALRAVTLTTYKRLVGELSLASGLRGTRIETHFDVLIGAQPQNGPFDSQAGSLLKKIAVAFSLEKPGNEVNTTEDSANLANFRIVKENLFDIYRSWIGFKKEVDKDFSELSGKLSRELAVIDDEVTDVETAMDEVGYDATDRESDVIETDETSAQTLTVDGLLSWIREFASEEAPELIEGGGAIGIEAALPSLEELKNLVNTLVTSPPVEDGNVDASLSSLEKHLEEAIRLANLITGKTP